jgi:uncharacterized protein YtpQ (UPF0354 family)
MSESNKSEILSPELFALYIERRLQNEGGLIHIIERKGDQLQVEVNQQPRTISLARFYQAYRQNPSEIDAVEHTLRRILLTELPGNTPQDFQALKTRIYPQLKPIDLLVTVRERHLPMLVYREFLGNLIITYVIDEERSLAFINEDHLDRWGVSMIDLHGQAIENLRRRTLELTDYVTTGEDEQRLFIFNSGDGYDATRLLLTDVLSRWADLVPGQLVIGAPNRDFLIAFSDADPDILRGVAAQIALDSQQKDYGLTEQLFTLEEGRVQLYSFD